MDLSHAKFVDVVSQYQNLQSINIACARNLTTESYIELATHHGHSLRALRINGLNGSAVKGFINLLNACKNLHTLHLNTAAASDLLHRVGDHIQLSTLVIIGECSHELLVIISQKQKHLKELCVNFSTGIEKALKDVVMSNCLHLRKLYLPDCKDSSFLSSVVEVCNNCPEFDVTAFPLL